MTFSALRSLIAVFLFLGTFAYYLHSAYPSVSVGDSGEFIATAHTLGIPHAPGYPTYVVLAKSFQLILPFGNIGYRTNVFSAACGALTVVLIFGLCLQLAFPIELAGCAALIFLFTHAQIVNSGASEVFTLHALFCGAVLMAVLADRWLLAIFLAGLGMGNHQTLVFLGPALALMYFTPFTTRRPPLWAMSLAFLAGLSVYGFLYFRAGQAPPLNAGNPDTWDRLWRVITRADYGSLTLALGDVPPRDLHSTGLQLGRFVQGLVDQVTWLGVALGVLGMGWGIWKRRPFITMLTIAFILVGPFFFVLGNLPFNAQSIGLLERFYIVPTFMWSILIVTGVWALAYNARMISLMAFALPVFLMTREAVAFPARTDFRAYSYGQNNLRTLPPGATFIMDGGDDTFYSLAYLTQVENRRRDITLHDRGGVVFPGLYGDDFRQLSRDEKEKRRQQIERTLAASPKPLLYSTMNDRIMPTPSFRLTGLLYGVPVPTLSDVFVFYDLRGIRPWQQAELARDYRTRALLPYYAYQRSIRAARDTLWNDAIGFSRFAYAVGPDALWLIPNLIHNAYTWAEINFQAGRLDTAEAFYRCVAHWDPKDAIAWSDLGAIEERRGRLELAMEDYQTAIRIDPQSEAAHYNLAVAYWKKTDWPNVIQQFRRVLEINPKNAAAQNYLRNAEARVK